MTVLAAHEIVRYLEGRGVTKVFGLCGHTVIAMLEALSGSERIEFVNVRHEQIASHAADGYARVTHRASVVLTHLGPGLTNAATGVANAALDSIPVVVIAGDVPTHYFGKHPHQEVNHHADADQWQIYRPFVKRAFRVERAELLPEILDRAFVIAESGRPGPVLVDVPMDLFSLPIEAALVDRALANHIDYAPPALDVATAERIVTSLAAAEHPLVYAGGGVLSACASEELTTLVDLLDLPVAHSLMGKGAVSDDNPHVLGMSGFWGMPFTNQMCRGADWILGLGTRFAEADSSSWYEDFTFRMPPTKLIQIDIDPEQIGRNYPVEIGAVADLKSALTTLLEAARRLYPRGVVREGVTGTILAERAARKEAEKRAADLAAQIKAAEDAGKTEAQKQAETLKSLQADLAAMRAEKERAEVAAKTGVPVDILAGPGDDPAAWAEQVKAWAAEQAKPTEAPAQPVVRHHGNPSGAGAASLDERIAAAEAAGDRTLTASLKALKLGSR